MTQSCSAWDTVNLVRAVGTSMRASVPSSAGPWYGLRAIYRRRIHLEWLFLELRTSITWPRETLLESREPNWGAGVALEMLFGERGR